MLKKTVIVVLLMGGLVLADEIQIRRAPARTQAVLRDGVVYGALTSLCEDLGVSLFAAGEGFVVGEAPPPEFTVPAGKVQVAGKLLDLWDEGEDPLVAAEAFCRALGGRTTRPERSLLNLIPPRPATAPVKVSRHDPASFYFSQIRSSSNPGGSLDNGNCGPCCMAMAARAFGRWPLEIADGDLKGMMTWVRKAMGHGISDESQGTNIPWLTRAAEKLGMYSQLFQSFDQLSGHLQKGRMVIVAGQLSQLGLPGGTHAMLVVGLQGDNALINDPGLFYKRPGTPVKMAELRKFFVLGIAVGE